MANKLSANSDELDLRSRLKARPRHFYTFLRRSARARWAEIFCAFFLLLMASSQIAVIMRKSITADEIVMIPAGYYYVIKGNPSLIHEHPPLSKILAGLPLLFFDLAPVPTRQEIPPDNQWDRLMRFWTDNRESFDSISFWTRVPAIALTMLLGVLIFLFAGKLFGKLAGVFAVALFSLEPTVLAHGRVVQTDMVAAFGFLLFFYALERYCSDAKWSTALGLGLSLAIAVLAKFSMLLVIPILGLAFLWRLLRSTQEGITPIKVGAHVLMIALTLLGVINAAYLFPCDCFSAA